MSDLAYCDHDALRHTSTAGQKMGLSHLELLQSLGQVRLLVTGRFEGTLLHLLSDSDL